MKAQKAFFIALFFLVAILGLPLAMAQAVSITYNNVTNTITCTGGTELAPITFWDLWNASDMNGWDIVNNTCDTQFKLWARLVIGDGVTPTWFADEGVQITWDAGVITANWQIFINVYNANFRLGKLVNAVTKETALGCSLIVPSIANATSIIRHTHSYSTTELYGSHFVNEGGTCECVLWPAYGNGTIYYCVLDNVGLRGEPSGRWDVYRISITRANHGLNRMVFGVFDDIQLIRTRSAIYTQTTQALTLRNAIIIDSVFRDVLVYRIITDKYFIDCELEDWSFVWSAPNTAKINRQYTFNLLVVDESGSPLENATAILYEADDNVAFNVSTGADGTIAEQIATRGYYNETGGSTLYDYGPHKLVVTYANNTRTIPNITLANPVDWTISMEPPIVEGDTIIMGSTGIVIICFIILAPIIAFMVKR